MALKNVLEPPGLVDGVDRLIGKFTAMSLFSIVRGAVEVYPTEQSHSLIIYGFITSSSLRSYTTGDENPCSH